ncbi:MAG TPA: sensor domain-containing diguanylate cyclase, partial [Thermoanaerobaculia bacterium]|nr:sensor domain-containing diguanylate cyclase [Thermoanaerobaculia bacterium]
MPKRRLSSPGPGAPAPGSPFEAEHLDALAEVARLASEDLALRPMLQRITDSLAARFGWEHVGLVRVDLEQGRFVCEALTTHLPTEIYVGYSRELGSGVVGQVAATGEPVLIDDARSAENFVQTLPGVLSEICVPIQHRGEVVGILNVESLELATFRGRLPLLQAIARQLAGAIASARLYEEVTLRAAAFEVLSEVPRLATGAGNLETRLGRVTDYLQKRFDLKLVAVVVSDEEGREWQHRAIATRSSSGLESVPTPQDRWPIGKGVIGRAIRLGEPQLVLDVSRDPDYFGSRGEIEAELAVPLRFSERILGALNYEADSAALFQPETVQLFVALADQIAGAIELAVVNRRLENSQSQIIAIADRLAKANRKLRRLTRIDGLTGVANRRCFEEQLELEWRRARRTGTPLSLALIDVDHFKAYNDSFGHLQGDECLRTLARILTRGIGRAGELVARWGGEEFASILPGST